MLARYLRTSQRPVRYAMHPDLAQALSNYLMIHSRAYDLPGAHHNVLSHLEGNPQLLTQLMHGILQGHHETPGMYLDKLHETSPMMARIPGRPYPESDDPLENLPYYLQQFAHVMGNPQHAYGYGPVGMTDPVTYRLLQDGWAGALPGQGFQPSDASWPLRHRAAENVPPDLRGYLRAAYGGRRIFAQDRHAADPLGSMLAQHDIAHEATRRGEGGHHAPTLTAGIREVLRDHLIPHLDELTRQMGGG